MDDKPKLTSRQRWAFEEHADKDPYEYTDRTHFALRQRDLPRLYQMRAPGDPVQGEAIKMAVEIRTAARLSFWTAMLTMGILVLGACTIVAAIIASN